MDYGFRGLRGRGEYSRIGLGLPQKKSLQFGKNYDILLCRCLYLVLAYLYIIGSTDMDGIVPRPFSSANNYIALHLCICRLCTS